MANASSSRKVCIYIYKERRTQEVNSGVRRSFLCPVTKSEPDLAIDIIVLRYKSNRFFDGRSDQGRALRCGGGMPRPHLFQEKMKKVEGRD